MSASLFQKSKKTARKWDILEAVTMGGLDVNNLNSRVQHPVARINRVH
jgi:hypothetical protein